MQRLVIATLNEAAGGSVLPFGASDLRYFDCSTIALQLQVPKLAQATGCGF